MLLAGQSGQKTRCSCLKVIWNVVFAQDAESLVRGMSLVLRLFVMLGGDRKCHPYH